MVWIKKIWSYICYPFVWLNDEIAYRKKIKELKQKDPFIYK